MQEPVYVLHLITCHGSIMPRLAELLFQFHFLQTACMLVRMALGGAICVILRHF